MGIETLKSMDENMYFALLMVMKIVALITVVFSIAGLAIYLVGIAWLYLEEMRQPLRRRVKAAPPSPKPGKCHTSTGRCDLKGTLTGGMPRREPALF